VPRSERSAPASPTASRWSSHRPGSRAAAGSAPGRGSPPRRFALRGVGGREIALHGLALGAFFRGSPVRPMLAASIAGDLADIAATAASHQGLPNGSAKATAAVAGGSLLLTLALAALVDD
jgi:hypothetical protein